MKGGAGFGGGPALFANGPLISMNLLAGRQASQIRSFLPDYADTDGGYRKVAGEDFARNQFQNSSNIHIGSNCLPCRGVRPCPAPTRPMSSPHANLPSSPNGSQSHRTP